MLSANKVDKAVTDKKSGLRKKKNNVAERKIAKALMKKSQNGIKRDSGFFSTAPRISTAYAVRKKIINFRNKFAKRNKTLTLFEKGFLSKKGIEAKVIDL